MPSLKTPVRSQQVAVVDVRYWEYEPNGTLFAPKAGENHAFRELISQTFPGYTDTPPGNHSAASLPLCPRVPRPLSG